jgi:hypothetical protein
MIGVCIATHPDVPPDFLIHHPESERLFIVDGEPAGGLLNLTFRTMDDSIPGAG